VRVIGGLIVAALLTAGCGSSSEVKVGESEPSSTSSSTETTETTSTSTPAPTTIVPSATWRSIPAAPGSADGAPVWTGEEFVVWGGGAQHVVAEGVAYRPTTNAWREVAASPLSARRGHSAVWTGKEIVYWGGLDEASKALADGAAYDPVADRWRRLPDAPIPGHFAHEAVWTGREMVVWGGTDQCCPIDSVIHDVEAVAYDPASDRWRRLADVPTPWSGDDGRAITGADAGDVLVWRDGHLGRLDMTANRWSDLGSPPPPPPASGPTCGMTGGPVTAGGFGGDRFYVWSGGCKAENGGVFDLRRSAWATISAAPDAGLSTVVATPDIFGVTGDQAPRLVRYDQTRRTWQSLLPPPPSSVNSGPKALWTGADVLLWGGFGEHPVRTGALYRP
jgi:hypothetical protein